MRHPPLHGQLVADYIRRNPGTQRRGFSPAVYRVAKTCEWFGFAHGEMEEALQAAFPLGFIPDAFRIDVEAREITIVEAEVTHRITPHKWECISEMYWNFREDDWDVWVHTIDQRGTVFSVDTPLVALMLAQEEEDPKVLASSPPGRVVWTPRDGERPADRHYWHDAIQRRLGVTWEPAISCVRTEVAR